MIRCTTIAACTLLAAPAFAQTLRISVDALGNEGNDESWRAALSFDGRTIAFISPATNLVPNDTNGSPDIFVKDLDTGTIVRASLSSSGDEGNSFSLYPVISGDGRIVAFYSHASNLVPGDTNGAGDTFVRDLARRSTEIVSISTTGTLGDFTSRGASISFDGRYVAFTSGATNMVAGDSNGFGDIFLRDRLLGTTVLASLTSTGAQGDWNCSAPSLSADGRILSFGSQATNFVPGDNNGKRDVFVRDLWTGTTERVSVSSAGAEGDDHSGFVHQSSYDYSAVSPDGRFVTFPSYATNLVPGDTNNVADVFLHDRANGTTVRASVSSTGAEASVESTYPVVWGNGRYVAFSGAAPDLVANDVNGAEDVFVHDFVTGATTLLSIDTQGVHGDQGSGYPVVSADGRVLSYESVATNLVAQDNNAVRDSFVRLLPQVAPPSTYCTSQVNSQGCAPGIAAAGLPSLSSTAEFRISAASSLNQAPGLLLYGFGPATLPMNGGTLCIAPPAGRVPAGSSGGTPLPAHDCSGELALDFNAWVQGPGHGPLAAGAEVFAQFWSRDVLAPASTHLTDAVKFTLEP